MTSVPPPQPPRRPTRPRRRGLAILISATLIGLGAVAIAAATALAAEVRSATLISTGPTAGIPTADVGLAAITADGSRVFFETEGQLTAGDTNSVEDVYERSGDVTRLVTSGTDPNPAELDAISADGSRVFFETDGALAAGDTDTRTDVYETTGGAPNLISFGPAGGNGEFDVQFTGISTDGERVFVRTEEPLVAADTDEQFDVYRRANGSIVRVSVGPNESNGPNFVHALAISEDGSRVVLWTAEQLVAADTDSSLDLFERAEGQTKLISTGSAGGNEAFNVGFTDASSDASVVLFRTEEALVAEDTDNETDAYLSSGGETTLISIGPNGGNGPDSADAREVSNDGSAAFFDTHESLVAADTDTEQDAYEWRAGAVKLVTTGTGPHHAFYDLVSADGSRVFYETDESLAPADADETYDVYERAGGRTTLVSTGSIGGGAEDPAGLEEVSADGTHAFFTTEERLEPEDTDDAADVYVRFAGRTELVSTGTSDDEAVHEGASADGSHAFFWTEEPLTGSDDDAAGDLYLSTVTTVPDPPAPPPPAAAAVAPPSNVTCLGKKATRVGSSGADTIRGTGKRDVIAAQGGDDRVFGNGGNDLICTGSGNDLARGGAGADEVTGGAGLDRLFGDAGVDRLFGQGGRDQMNGGAGSDSCRDARPSRRSGCE